MTRHFEESRIYPGVDVQTAYDGVRPAPLPEVFSTRSGPFPPVAKVTEQVGEWGTEVGQTRRIHLSDGGSTFETMIALDAPRSFAYTLSEIKGPLKLIVSGLRGQWSFAEESGGTRVTWTWDVEPRNRADRAAGPAAADVLELVRRQGARPAETAGARAESIRPRPQSRCYRFSSRREAHWGCGAVGSASRSQ